MNAKEYIAFDQYQRYETVSRIINFFRKDKPEDVFKILEIGSNEHKDLKLFLPQDHILFSDIVLTEKMQNDSEFRQLDGTNLPFEDAYFDFVVATDVLEHIPKEKRQSFLSELYRVSKRSTVLCFPFDSSDIKDAESRVNTYYKTISGEDFIWLKEHIENGLPNLEEINTFLNENKILFLSFFHGDIETWERFWYCHFDTVFMPETLEYRTNIDHYYNEKIYPSDISDSCYRAFYVMSHTNIEDLDLYIKNMWGKKKTNNLLSTLFEAHRQAHVLSQSRIIQLELHNKEVHIQNIEAERKSAEEKWNTQLLQLEEEQRSKEDQWKNRFAQLAAEQKSKEDQWNQRFASQETQISELSKRAESLETEKNTAETQIENEKKHCEILGQEIREKELAWKQTVETLKRLEKESKEEVYSLQNRILELEKDLQKENSEKKEMKAVLEDHDRQLAQYQLHYHAAINQRSELAQQLAQTQAMYATISNAACWKITKPIRLVLDATKSLLKRNQYTYLFCKGLKSLKQNGFSYTWKKVQDRRHHRQNFLAAKPLYSQEELQRQKTEKFPKEIKFSIVVPLYNTPENFLHEMIQSVLDQTYQNWELCMADGSDEKHAYVKKVCQQYARKDRRILYKKLEENLGISGNTNACIEMTSGDYIGLFDHDDLLHPAALYEVMHAICDKNADFIYTDELTFSNKIENVITAHFKPDFAIDNLRANNYICHFSVLSKELLKKSGLFRSEYDGSQDHDFILRLTENAERIVHIPKILYYWRSHPNSVAEDINSKAYAINAGKKAVKDHLYRCGMNADVQSSVAFPTIYQIKYALKGRPLISIIIPNKNHYEDLSRCIESILNFTTYPNYEIVVVDNGSDNEKIVEYYNKIKKCSNIKIIEWNHPFNFSAINNFAVSYANGEYLVFLNNDTQIITKDWLEEMLMYAQRADVGAVGAKLYYADNTIQHAGIVLGLGAHRTAGHIFYRTPKENVGYMGRLYYAQNLSAVTAACMMVSKKVWNEIDGFDESFEVAFNDVDLCMRIRKAGYLIVWTPYAELYHYESKSRGPEDTPEKKKRFEGEVRHFQQRWAKELAAGDPYYNPNFSLDREDFSLK